MSGIDVAGIVLAVLPIAVKAAKSCSEGIDESKKLFRTKHHNEIKGDLFDDLYRELFLFDRHVKKILQTLPDISEQRCAQVLATLNQEDWQSQSDIVQALKRHLNSDFSAFEHAVREVYYWTNKIFADADLQFQGLPKNTDTFLENLKAFTDASRAINTESEFKARLQFWRREGKLKEEVKKFKKWRKFVEKITENTQCQYATNSAVKDRNETLRPLCVIPRLSRGLYRVLAESWRCGSKCPGIHRAKICLQGEPELHRKADGDRLKYRLLLLRPPDCSMPRDEHWLETTITVKCQARRSKVSFDQINARSEQVQSMCSTISTHPWKREHKLRFVVNYFEQDTSSEIHHDRKYITSEFGFQPMAKEVKLKDILTDLGQQLDLAQKRKLALELAYGMMTLSGSPWLEERWSKEHISFFYTDTNNICHTQPLVSSDMKHFSNQHQRLPLDIMHPLPPVLSLGILLLELETGKAIESMRTEDDYVDPVNQITDENTDFTAAIREARMRSMSSPQYKEAVLACLYEQGWDDGQGDEPSVLEERVRRRIYEQIISRLESDLEALSA